MLGAANTAWSARAWAATSTTRRTTSAATLGTFTFTGYNGATYTTSLSQFGAGSADLVSAGNNRIMQYSSWSGPYPSGTGDFCIEGWVYKPAARGTATTGDPIVNNVSGGLGIRFGQGYNTGGFNYLSLFARGQADLDYAAFTWPSDAWCHWAVQRKSSTISFWANGNKLTTSGGSGGGARNFAAPSSSILSIGSYDNGATTDETMRSYLDEMCVSNSWRYDDTKSTYTIPTAAFTVDTITDMLIHFDSNLTTAAT
jgi:hypothetical protein